MILEPGSVTSHYSEFSRSDTIGDPTEEILAITSVVIDDGGRWTPDDDGTTRVSYSFVGYDSLVVTDDNSTWWYDAIEEVTPLTQFTVEQEIARIEGYTNLDLVWVEDYGESGANIRIGYHQFVIGGASSAPNEHPYAAEVFVGIHVGEAYNATFFVHELGHSLGFNDLPEWNEFTGEDYTIMSYIKSARYQDAEYSTVTAYQYMYADIAGLQYLYGVDTEATADDQVYSYDLSKPILETLFDAGGADTISVIGTGEAVHINLTPGSWSNIGPDIRYDWNSGNNQAIEPGTLFIMPNTVIENALGSSGNDTITGNDADNFLRADAGHDVVAGGGGNDRAFAGPGDTGNDTVEGNAGNDLLGGGAGNDMLVGGDMGADADGGISAGSDTLYGGSGDDVLAGGDYNSQTGEAISTGTNANALWAGAGDDTVWGDNGADQIGGGLDDDKLSGAGGNDTLYGGRSAGADDLSGGAGNDLMFAAGGTDTLSGGSGADTLFGGGGNDLIDGGSGNDLIFGGGGDDQLAGGAGDDTFGFVNGFGNDTLSDFGISNGNRDVLDFSEIAGLSVEEIVSAATFSDGNTILAIGDHGTVVLAGISETELQTLADSGQILV